MSDDLMTPEEKRIIEITGTEKLIQTATHCTPLITMLPFSTIRENENAPSDAIFKQTAAARPNLARALDWHNASAEDKPKVFRFQRSLKAKCPHCGGIDGFAMRMFSNRWFGAAMCRSEACGQAYNVFDTDIYDANGCRVTEDYTGFPV